MTRLQSLLKASHSQSRPALHWPHQWPQHGWGEGSARTSGSGACREGHLPRTRWCWLCMPGYLETRLEGSHSPMHCSGIHLVPGLPALCCLTLVVNNTCCQPCLTQHTLAQLHPPGQQCVACHPLTLIIDSSICVAVITGLPA
jgi:hypothetical protein